MPGDRWLSTSLVARRYGVTRRTVLCWIHAGAVRASCFPGGHWHIQERDLTQIHGRSRSIAVDPGLTADPRSLSPSRDA
jgi:excisionase family DNA binding protein